MSLAGKNVVFVGALGGIAFEACKTFMTKKLAYLVVLDIIDNPKQVQTLQAIDPKCKVHYIKYDITDKAAIKKGIAEIVSLVKYIDVLVNGSGVLSDPDVEFTLNVNLVGLINTTFEALPYMNKNQNGRGGVLINIASIYGLEACPAAIVYGASKFGVMGFSRSLADPYYYNLTGVAVITFCPGLTETPLKNNLAGKYSFSYSQPLGQKANSAKTQTTASCGADIVTAAESNQNGAIFISDLGKLRTIEPKVFWQPTYD